MSLAISLARPMIAVMAQPLSPSSDDFQIAPGLIRGGTFSRAQAGGAQSTALASDGATIQYFAADVPRFNGTARRLLIEGQRTNVVPNPRAEGGTPGVIGAGGVEPTGWSLTGINGITANFLGAVNVNGFPGARVRHSGTSTASATNVAVRWLQPGVAAASAGQTWVSTTTYRLVAGDMANFSSIVHRTLFPGGSPNDLFAITVSGTAATISRVNTTTGTPTSIQVQYNAAVLLGLTAASDIDFLGAQSELGAFPSSLILPAVGTPAAATRGRDVLTFSLAELGIPASGAGTYTGVVMFPQAAPAGAGQTIIRINDGTANDAIYLTNLAGGLSVVLGRGVAGAFAETPIGSHTAGVAVPFGLIVYGNGTADARLGTGSWTNLTGLPTSGLVQISVGNAVVSGFELFGEIGWCRFDPAVLSQSTAAARMAALPLT